MVDYDGNSYCCYWGDGSYDGDDDGVTGKLTVLLGKLQFWYFF